MLKSLVLINQVMLPLPSKIPMKLIIANNKIINKIMW